MIRYKTGIRRKYSFFNMCNFCFIYYMIVFYIVVVVRVSYVYNDYSFGD